MLPWPGLSVLLLFHACSVLTVCCLRLSGPRSCLPCNGGGLGSLFHHPDLGLAEPEENQASGFSPVTSRWGYEGAEDV